MPILNFRKFPQNICVRCIGVSLQNCTTQIVSYHSLIFDEMLQLNQTFWWGTFSMRGKMINLLTFCQNVTIWHNFLAVTRPAPIEPNTECMMVCIIFIMQIRTDSDVFCLQTVESNTWDFQKYLNETASNAFRNGESFKLLWKADKFVFSFDWATGCKYLMRTDLDVTWLTCNMNYWCQTTWIEHK